MSRRARLAARPKWDSHSTAILNVVGRLAGTRPREVGVGRDACVPFDPNLRLEVSRRDRSCGPKRWNSSLGFGPPRFTAARRRWEWWESPVGVLPLSGVILREFGWRSVTATGVTWCYSSSSSSRKTPGTGFPSMRSRVRAPFPAPKKISEGAPVRRGFLLWPAHSSGSSLNSMLPVPSSCGPMS